eukprot:6932473-Prymnesium_polylepis.1
MLVGASENVTADVMKKMDDARRGNRPRTTTPCTTRGTGASRLGADIMLKKVAILVLMLATFFMLMPWGETTTSSAAP